MTRFALVSAVLFGVSFGCSHPPPASSPPTSEAAENGNAKPSVPLSKSAESLPPPDAREAALSKAVLELLDEAHLLGKRIDDDVSKSAFATYMDRLDSGKMFLLASDRASLQKYADKIDDELRSGRLDLAHDGAKLFVSRVEVVDKMIQDILAKPMNHDDDESVELDAKKLQPAATDDELKERWRQRLELEVMERVAGMEDRIEADKKAAAEKKKNPKAGAGSGSGSADGAIDDDVPAPGTKIPETAEGREEKARNDLAKSYSGRFARLRNPSKLDAASDLVNAVTAALDPHTDYLPPAEKANFDIHMSGSLEGIGAVLREKDHYTEVVEIVPGGASSRMGKLKAGDLILSVQQDGQEAVDIADMRIDDVVSMIRGKKGTVVRLRVQKATGAQETYAITRDTVVVEETYARGAIVQKKGGPELGYIHLPSFYGGKGSTRTASSDVHHLLMEMKAKKVAGVVIDLRSNPGGLLAAAVDMTGDLIDKGPVVQVQDGKGRKEVLSDKTGGEDYDGPVVVMVDRFSASASEIVAGAVQDYGRAVIVGEGAQTHGKGTVQSLVDLDGGSGDGPGLGTLKVTIQQFFRPSGSSTQMEGVKADIVLPDPTGHIEAGEKQLEHAIAWSKIDPAPHQQWPANWNIEDLKKKSAVRVAKQPILSKVASATGILKARMADTKVPLQRAAWEARRKQQKAELEAASPDLKAAPAAFTVTSIPDPGATTPPAKDERLQHWRDNLSKDAWVEESMAILGDMQSKK